MPCDVNFEHDVSEERLKQLFEQAEHDQTVRSLLKLARKDILAVGYDESHDEFTWALSTFAVEMYENGGRSAIEQYIRATETPGTPTELNAITPIDPEVDPDA